MELEQYAAMSEQLHNYTLWEQDYYTSDQIDSLSLPFAQVNNNFYAQNTTPNPTTNQHMPPQPHAYTTSSSPETANPAGSPGKTKRRRSKGGAAGAQPTTFLNASISNFRAVVQQHTGCHSSTSSPKGPITLCFANATATAQEGYRFGNHYYCS